MNALPLLPAVFIDFCGSAMAILLSFTALRYSRELVRMQPSNFIWGFLFYFCIAMATFSLSRGVGHIIRILLVFSDRADIWKILSPFSGGVNTLLMISAAAVTIYYHKGLAAYKIIRGEAEKLSKANVKLSSNAEELQKLNFHLEEMVEERTRNLSVSEKKFRNFFENSKDIIFFSDNDNNITHLNNSGKKLLGLDIDNARVNFLDLFADGEDRKSYSTELADTGFVSDLEMECRGSSGEAIHILLSANAVIDPDGSVTGYEGIGKDMTRIKTITEQLINHEKMASVGQMAAGVAHEINTPLGIILGYTQLMMDDFTAESEEHANLKVVERQTKACRRIVSDLLKFSRQAESIKSSLNINNIIEEVLSVTEHNLNIHNVYVRRHFEKGLPVIYGDSEKLRQVFINIFNNAQYAMKEGGEIIITTGKQEEDITISVRDTGSGIEEDVINRIFDPFFTTKDVGQGTGLGLSVTYGIIQEHGGEISVESPVKLKEKNEKVPGSKFHIRLPIAAGNQPDLKGENNG